MDVTINPSILSADFLNLQSEFLTIQTADAIHVDVMDGHFVPNLTFGLPVVRRMAEISPLPLDVHLMIDDVDYQAQQYADAGVASVTFHVEATTQPTLVARAIRSTGAKASIALKPESSLDMILDSLDEFDRVLIMTVEPGFGGQKFIEEMLPKIDAARSEIRRLGLGISLQVDGGIDRDSIVLAAIAGADSFVAGSSVFKHTNRSEEILALRRLAESNYSE